MDGLQGAFAVWLHLGLGLLFIFIGLAIHVFKWYFLIAGYNTMPKEKKANVDTAGLGRLMGLYGYLNGIVFIIFGALHAFGFQPHAAPTYAFFIISTIYLLVRAQRYDGNIFGRDGKLRAGAWKQLALPAGIVVITLTATAALLFYSAQPTRATLLDEGLRVHGMYGGVYTWDSIRSTRLAERLPAVEMRTNGASLGSRHKGYFRTSEYGTVKLFVDTKHPPFIYLETDQGITILNLGSAAETRRLFKQMCQGDGSLDTRLRR